MALLRENDSKIMKEHYPCLMEKMQGTALQSLRTIPAFVWVGKMVQYCRVKGL